MRQLFVGTFQILEICFYVVVSFRHTNAQKAQKSVGDKNTAYPEMPKNTWNSTLSCILGMFLKYVKFFVRGGLYTMVAALLAEIC